MSNRLRRDRSRNRIGEFEKVLRKGASFVLAGYIMIIAVYYPLYLTESGYANIGYDKYLFYRKITYMMLGVTAAPVMMIWMSAARSFYRERLKRLPGLAARTRESWRYLKRKKGLSPTQGALVFFLLAAALSWVFSAYRETAFRGNEDWFIGLETFFLVMLSYLLISRYFIYGNYIWRGFLAGAGAAFFLGICHRFSFYPLFNLSVKAPHFISTLGNINWVAGYFAVLWPVGAGLYVFAEQKGLRYRYIAGAYTFAAMCLGIVQGADSAFLSFIAVFYILLLICLGRWEKYGAAYLELLIAWCLAGQLMRFFRIIWPVRFNYGEVDIGGVLTATSLTVYPLLPAVILYLLTRLKKPRFFRLINNKRLKKAAVILPVAGVILFIMAVAINTGVPGGIPGLAGSRLFTYSDGWGNSRGLTWKMGITLFARMDPLQRLIGVGPDCYAKFLYSFPDLAAISNTHFNAQILKNAHNEILTMMVNTGIAGTAAYLSIFVTLGIRLSKKAAAQPFAYIPVLCMFSYLIHNMVSFSQILNLPVIFIIMAIGESSMKICR